MRWEQGTTNEKAQFAKVNEHLKVKGLNKDSPIILLCGSGKRAAKAASALKKGGYNKGYSAVDGYNGWQRSKLKWTKSLEENKMYMEKWNLISTLQCYFIWPSPVMNIKWAELRFSTQSLMFTQETEKWHWITLVLSPFKEVNIDFAQNKDQILLLDNWWC